ncbi:hybrid sensor histidine kinase/response regulator [Hymenobacter sp. BT186]|uniref:histidine kinase n=1 Tax=Hymenobacter telluris TaxID=2816474 RepID=A0A939EVZ4_9BACT|nr:hybrid sensor histidine kinase/response regulator [Hymenobacter telluris]MBO0358515.1 hybrid sensor histidine kinase/response regulator [Hymenobacter telluris]MBW3374541.1 hybrid sensor histidine kinase/response regulator [Hymenobacter norwichensis]
MKNILLVDDNEQDRMLYKRYLSKQREYEQLELHEAASGAEAVALFAAKQPDCVLLDYNLLDTDGLTLLRELKELAPDTLCVVMITGGGSEQLAVRALNSGAFDYLVKGQFDQELLCKTVIHAIEKSEWQQRMARYHQELTQANAELAVTNQQLARTNTDLDNFVYAASHDLRQPVNNLRGLFDELRRTATVNDPDAAHMWFLFDKSLQALTTTISDLADVVQVARQPDREATETVEMAALTELVLQTLHPQVVEAAATIETDFTGLPTLTYAPSSLRTILLNLLANTLKYRHPNRPARVRVRTYLNGRQAVLEVQDNGLGMNLDLYGNELFQLFRRFHPEASEGTGVGLFLVNRLVRAEGGHIEVESQEELGTTFRVYLRG